MELVNVREIFKNTIRYEKQQVTIGGWVRSNRNSKNFGFSEKFTIQNNRKNESCYIRAKQRHFCVCSNDGKNIRS